MKKYWLAVLALVLCLVTACNAQAPSQQQALSASKLTIQEIDGGSVVTDLAYGIQVNKGSTLHRRWFILTAAEAPAQLANAGIRTVYESGQYRGDYKFKPAGFVRIGRDVMAFEVRFVLFDIWGNHMKTLSGTHVKDISAGSGLELDEIGSWPAFENEVSDLMTVVAYVSNARLRDGSTWRQDPKAVLEALNGIRLKLDESDLAPAKEKR